MPNKKLDVLHIAAECSPFIKVGGLGDVLGSLPNSLATQGLKTAVLLPKYGLINDKKFGLKKVADNIVVNIGVLPKKVALYYTRLPKSKVDYYFLDHHIFSGHNIYSNTSKLTSIERFTFFNKAAVEVIRQYLPRPTVIQAHDWHAGLIPTFIDQASQHYAGFHQIKTLFTIHNLAQQGQTKRDLIDYMNISPEQEPALMEDYYDDDYLNLMKIAILSADLINTVSPNYAKEILTKKYGAGLETYLQRRRGDLSGILNGIDLKEFNPQKDHELKYHFKNPNWIKAKSQNKTQLRSTLGLPDTKGPLYGLINRLTDQKGLDILIPSLKAFLKKDIQVVILGTGNPTYHQQLKKLSQQYPDKLAVRLEFNLTLAKQIYAGSDFFLMPSAYEPCGLGQMIAMRYGSVPVVRITGGLKDTVQNMLTGFTFSSYTTSALTKTLVNSLKFYQRKKSWYTLVNNCLQQDFSWGKSAQAYINLYKKLQ